MIPGLPGLHSFVIAQDNGKWLIIGGRKDGSHARQPFRSFPGDENNTNIYVIDAAEKKYFSSTVKDMPSGLKEQLQSCLLYTSPSPRDRNRSRMPSSA